MKKYCIYNYALALTILLTAFNSCISSQSPIPVRGTGDVTNKTYEVSNFSGIDVSGGFDVDLVQGSSESLVLSAQENLFEYLTVEVVGGILKVYVERNIIQTKGMKAKIYLKSINSLKVSGGGDVSSENTLDFANLAVEISGGGDLKTNLKTGELKCHLSGGGDANINGEIGTYDLNISGGGDLQSEITSGIIQCSVTGGGDVTLKGQGKSTNANISISGGGDLKMDIDAEDVKCSLNGGGDATLSGNANNLDISISGGGDVNAARLVTQKTEFRANGGSEIHINASSALTGNISGGGDVYYSGNPGIVNIDAKGGSEVHKE